MSETSALSDRTWLRQWRDFTRTPQEEAAERVRISRNRWSEIERGEGCAFELARRIEDLTGIASRDWHRTDDWSPPAAATDKAAAGVAAQ